MKCRHNWTHEWGDVYFCPKCNCYKHKQIYKDGAYKWVYSYHVVENLYGNDWVTQVIYYERKIDETKQTRTT